jgi:hypothetical protein
VTGTSSRDGGGSARHRERYKPRSYRDRKAVAIEAAEHLKRKHPNADVMVKDLRSGEATAVAYKPDLGLR